jgi:hypothetical protein
MSSVPTMAEMLTVIGVALLAVVVLSAVAGALLTRLTARIESRPAGGTPARQAPAPQPRPQVPSQRTRQPAGAR